MASKGFEFLFALKVIVALPKHDSHYRQSLSKRALIKKAANP